MNDYEIMMQARRGLGALPNLPNDPDDAMTVALTHRELVLLASIGPLVALSFPMISPYVLDLDGKLKDLVEAQKPEWLLDGSEG